MASHAAPFQSKISRRAIEVARLQDNWIQMLGFSLPMAMAPRITEANLQSDRDSLGMPARSLERNSKPGGAVGQREAEFDGGSDSPRWSGWNVCLALEEVICWAFQAKRI